MSELVKSKSNLYAELLKISKFGKENMTSSEIDLLFLLNQDSDIQKLLEGDKYERL